jgi:hypothetical protein
VVAEQPHDLVHAAGRVLRLAVVGQLDIGQVPAVPPPGEREDEFPAVLADGDLVPARDRGLHGCGHAPCLLAAADRGQVRDH